jgi:glycyl-tRNA synthetase beta chain
MKGEFLLEIGTEEIPAGYLEPALGSLADLFGRALANARIGCGEIRTFGTPRRLVLCASGVEKAQASQEIEKTGPPVASAFDEQGQPTKAALGFAKSQGVEVTDLVRVQTPRGEQLAVRKVEQGLSTSEVLAGALPGLLERVAFPKTMRWMDLDVRFVRPIHWIVALLDATVVPFTIGNIQSGNLSRGHRFDDSSEFPVTSLQDLQTKLEERGVVLDQARRRRTIEERIQELAKQENLRIFEDNTLLDEVTFLVESPYPVMGRFASEFLELPASILITCMKKHQRYFSVQDGNGRITNRFIAINNTPVKDPAVSIKGHQRVLKARLEDARFYFREDRKIPLIDHLDALKGVVFHSKLGTAYEKVERFRHLARKLAERLAPESMAHVERASLLCKCDLETGIVYEFPELQGIIGSYYAKMDGEIEEVSTAVREHYLPAHAGDTLPQGMAGALISIADRMDTLVGCFSVGLIPTGAADPYALRRHVLGIIQILIQLDRPLDLEWLVREAREQVGKKRTRDADQVESDVKEFIRTRFVYFHTSKDFPLDVVEAVVRARFSDVVDARRRVEALASWKKRDDFDAIMIGFRRVVNILKDMPNVDVRPELFVEDAEKRLFAAFTDVKARVTPLVGKGDYVQALEILAELKPPIDTFFDAVMVMVQDEKIRNNRLGLLRTGAGLFGEIADFSFIGSTAETK